MRNSFFCRKNLSFCLKDETTLDQVTKFQGFVDVTCKASYDKYEIILNEWKKSEKRKMKKHEKLRKLARFKFFFKQSNK
jgi:hypothetical protein